MVSEDARAVACAPLAVRVGRKRRRLRPRWLRQQVRWLRCIFGPRAA